MYRQGVGAGGRFLHRRLARIPRRCAMVVLHTVLDGCNRIGGANYGGRVHVGVGRRRNGRTGAITACPREIAATLAPCGGGCNGATSEEAHAAALQVVVAVGVRLFGGRRVSIRWTLALSVAEPVSESIAATMTVTVAVTVAVVAMDIARR